jgi:NAD(P)-dependent dehydrogenase (short-subunit alcohol dehydrogenase family)
MQDFAGKYAFVTGAANGIGLGIARALARAGAVVALADIEREPLERARAELEAIGARAIAVTLDVSDGQAVEAAAREVEARYGKLHLLVNNAGVSLGRGPAYELTAPEWSWLLSVNVLGAVNGVRAFLPLLKRHGEPAHIVNTASIAGLQVNPNLLNGSYAMTKYAVVAFSEALELELAGSPIGVSVLCPGLVSTSLERSSRRRPERFGGAFEKPLVPAAQLLRMEALSPDALGNRVLFAIRNGEFFIFTHEESRAWIERRHGRIMAAFDTVERYNAALKPKG